MENKTSNLGELRAPNAEEVGRLDDHSAEWDHVIWHSHSSRDLNEITHVT